MKRFAILMIIAVGAIVLVGFSFSTASAAPESDAGSEKRATTSSSKACGVTVEAPKKAASAGKKPAVENKNGSLEGIDLKAMVLRDGAYRETLSNGRKVTFTVDPALQGFQDKLFADYKVSAGGAVVLNAKTGKVLAMSSRREEPTFMKTANVAVEASAPAASLFKIVTAAALLQETKVNINTLTCYRGGASRLQLSNIEATSAGSGARCGTLTDALAFSINSIFGQLADRQLRPEVIEQYAERFEFNNKIPFDVPVQSSTAEIPSERLEKARAAAGFWHTRLSPLHAAMIMQSVAHKGAMLRPYIVDYVEDKNGTVIYQSSPKTVTQAISQGTANTLLKAMKDTVSRGTARKAFRSDRGVAYLPEMAVSGKTGTLDDKDPYRAYTWFVGAAPADNPEVVVAVLVVNSPLWHIKGPKAAALILQKYFQLAKKTKK